MDCARPDCEFFHSNGVVRLQRWNSYREDHQPTYISYDKNGVVTEMRWVVGGNYIRKDYGPTMIRFHSNGNKASEAWYTTSMSRACSYLDRKDGPAVSFYQPDGTVVHEQYWVDGVEVPLDEARTV